MVRLRPLPLAVVCLQLLFCVHEAYGNCVNDTEICSTAGDNKCEISGVTYCCDREDRVIRATYSDDESAIITCSCQAPSPSNTGHRCTKRNVNSAPGMPRTSAPISLLTCAVTIVLVLLLSGLAMS